MAKGHFQGGTQNNDRWSRSSSNVSSHWSGVRKCRRTKDNSNFMLGLYVPCIQGLPL